MSFLKSALLAATAMTATSAAADTMIYATDLPPTHFISVHAVEPMMKCMTEGTNGALDFNYMPSGQLVKRNEMVDALNKGLAQFAYSSTANESANLPLQGVTMLPGMSDSALNATKAWRHTLDTDTTLAKELVDVNVHPVFLALLAPYQIMGKEKLDTVASWEGKKIRATGSALSVLVDAIGATAVQMSANDIYVALERGTVDGTILSFASVKPYSVHEAATHYSRNLSLGTAGGMIGMNLEHYNSLPQETRDVIDACGREAEIALAQWIDDNEGKIRDEFAANGAVIYDVSDEALAEFNAKLEPVEADFTNRLNERGLPAEQALAEFKAALGK